MARALGKKSSEGLKLCRKLLRTSQDMQIVDDGATVQVEEILAQAATACPSSLLVTNRGEGMLNRHPLVQLAASLLGLLA